MKLPKIKLFDLTDLDENIKLIRDALAEQRNRMTQKEFFMIGILSGLLLNIAASIIFNQISDDGWMQLYIMVIALILFLYLSKEFLYNKHEQKHYENTRKALEELIHSRETIVKANKLAKEFNEEYEGVNVKKEDAEKVKSLNKEIAKKIK